MERPAREVRLAFLELGEADRERLLELQPLLERHADSLVAAFYRHLLSFESTRTLLTDPEVRDRLLESQREYLLSLSNASLDDDYIAQRTHIGETHLRVGLDPSWYLGAYALYSSLLIPLIQESFHHDPKRIAPLLASLQKVLYLDAQLAMEAYIAKREEQLDFLNRELAATGRGLAHEVDVQRVALRETTERARAAEQLASIGTLAAGLAHEIGTPMSVIRGHAELLEGAIDDDRSRWRLQTILEQIDRVSRIMQGLLNLARPRDPVRTKIELDGVVDTSLSFLREKLRKRGVEVQRSNGAVPPVYGDTEKLQQLFLNLTLNAADAMPDGGTLRIDIGSGADGSVEVAFADTGSGISEADLGQIFEPFVTSKPAGQGSGLGLVVAKGIVSEHGGEIDVDSELGKGTVFRVRLPAYSSDAEHGNAPRS